MAQILQSHGIYHGLPTFPPHVKGVNGISGYHMLQVLLKNPDRWSKIYCLSRRPPITSDLPAHVTHIAVDFLNRPEEIAKVLTEHGVQADYVFFFSYIQIPPSGNAQGLWSSAEEMCSVNGKLLQNFLVALAAASIKPRRFMLQTGAKNYGSHIGPTKLPVEEWDPRVSLEPNFYYTQEDTLWAYCKENDVGWNIAMPAAILGAVPDAAINFCFPLAIYATVCKYLNQPLDFPGDIATWQGPIMHSSAMLNGYFEEWAVLTDNTVNQKFNICDNSLFSFESFWPRLAGWYGIEWKGPEEKDLTEVEWGYFPPPRGYGPRGKIRYKFSLTDWANRPDIKESWKEIAAMNNLSYRELSDIERVFGTADWMLHLGDPFVMSMDKSRKCGWHGFVDSTEAMLEVFNKFVTLKMIPPLPLVDVRFL